MKIDIAHWGDATVPFQLVGKNPIIHRDDNPDHKGFWEYARGHLGFFGYLRVANRRIESKMEAACGTPFGLFELPDRLWRDAYENRQHPLDAADEALAEYLSEMGHPDVAAQADVA